MLTWEYPPKSVGGLAEHVSCLSRGLYKLGDEVHVLTCEAGAAPQEDYDRGVFVHRVSPLMLQNEDFIKWVMHLNFALLEKAIGLMDGGFDIIHAHDWLTLYSARVLKKAFSIPMVCTLHSTEYGRNNGIRTDVQKYISSVEWMLTYEAWKIVTCSSYMRHEVNRVFNAPWEKIWVIPNGVDLQAFRFEFDWLPFRRNFAGDQEKLVFYIGRHVYEKGLQVLVEASYRIIREIGDVRFVLAGTGPMTDEIKNRVWCMGVQDHFVFPGYIDLDTKNRLFRVASAAVFPSLYEPFGIVALEAMAAECPVVVSDTGGLGELVRHEEDGLKAIPGSADSLADNLIRLLKSEELANRLKRNALWQVQEKYDWDKIAVLTKSMYQMVKDEEKTVL
jgi:glycosyltransferase involved in cell wall biosynthesis